MPKHWLSKSKLDSYLRADSEIWVRLKAYIAAKRAESREPGNPPPVFDLLVTSSGIPYSTLDDGKVADNILKVVRRIKHNQEYAGSIDIENDLVPYGNSRRSKLSGLKIRLHDSISDDDFFNAGIPELHLHPYDMTKDYQEKGHLGSFYFYINQTSQGYCQIAIDLRLDEDSLSKLQEDGELNCDDPGISLRLKGCNIKVDEGGGYQLASMRRDMSEAEMSAVMLSLYAKLLGTSTSERSALDNLVKRRLISIYNAEMRRARPLFSTLEISLRHFSLHTPEAIVQYLMENISSTKLGLISQPQPLGDDIKVETPKSVGTAVTPRSDTETPKSVDIRLTGSETDGEAEVEMPKSVGDAATYVEPEVETQQGEDRTAPLQVVPGPIFLPILSAFPQTQNGFLPNPVPGSVPVPGPIFLPLPVFPQNGCFPIMLQPAPYVYVSPQQAQQQRQPTGAVPPS